jgi:hypothetical protein
MLGYTFLVLSPSTDPILAPLQAYIHVITQINQNIDTALTKEDVALGLLDVANEASLGNDLFRLILSVESCLNTDVS